MSARATYAEATYWDERYSNDTAVFEWYVSYDVLGNFLERHLNKSDDVLHVGNGNSDLPGAATLTLTPHDVYLWGC